MSESLEKIKGWEADLVLKKVELDNCKTKEEIEAKYQEIEKVRNQKSALQSRVNRKLEALNLQGNVDKLQKLAMYIIFDVFEPELTDAGRERAHHML